jgi:uncharacterized protein
MTTVRPTQVVRRALLALGCTALAWFVSAPLAEAAGGTVLDGAGLLTMDEGSKLEDQAAAVALKHNIGVLVRTTLSLSGETVAAENENYYYERGLGYDGISLLVAMNEREWDIAVYGYAQDVLSVSAQNEIGEAIVPYLSSGEYAEAFTLFLNEVDWILDAAPPGWLEEAEAAGIEREKTAERDAAIQFGLLGGGGIGLVTAASVVWIWKRRLNTARFQAGAGAYQSADLQLHIREDDFIRSVTTHTPIPRDTSSSHSGGGGGGGGRASARHTGGSF